MQEVSVVSGWKGNGGLLETCLEAPPLSYPTLQFCSEDWLRASWVDGKRKALRTASWFQKGCRNYALA